MRYHEHFGRCYHGAPINDVKINVSKVPQGAKLGYFQEALPDTTLSESEAKSI